MIRGNASAEEAAESVIFARRSNGGGSRRHWPGRLQRGEPGEFVSGGRHLGAQPVENGEGGFFRARSEIARGAHAGGAALFAGARSNKVACFLHEEIVRSKEWFRKADAAGISIVQVQVGFKEFFGFGENGIRGWREVYFERTRARRR